MRILFCLFVVFISLSGFSQEDQNAVKHKLESAVTFKVNSNGFAAIPAFSLGKPASVASVNLKKGRFSYDPTLAYSFEAKPWFIDNWFRYRIVVRPEFELRTGINITTFCTGLEIDGDEIVQAQRYFQFALTGTYRFTPVSSLSIDYWSNNGYDKGTLKGHFISMIFDRSEIYIGQKSMLAVNMMLFYINHNGNNDGLFISPTVSFSLRDFPAALFFQASQAIQSNISPWPGFRWNVGLSYSL